MFFIDLLTRTDDARRAFETNPVIVKAVAEGMSLERYRKMLLELYHIVWHFNTVSAAGASRLQDDHKEVRYFLYEHMHEESGHEQWVLNDLSFMGITAEAAVAYKPTESLLALVGYNYYAADRKHPASVLGMLYALEVIASVYGGAFTAALKEALLLEDDKGVSFIGSHATLDAEHLDELRQVLDPITDEKAQDAIVESINVNFHHFARVMEAC
jgi:pyrroloquinoline quinone (PQQ) biosynthesis protein C